MPLIFLVWVVLGWLQIVAAHTGGGEGFFNGLLDTLIAAHALSQHALLVTNNTREFAKVPGLLLDNWVDAD